MMDHVRVDLPGLNILEQITLWSRYSRPNKEMSREFCDLDVYTQYVRDHSDFETWFVYYLREVWPEENFKLVDFDYDQTQFKALLSGKYHNLSLAGTRFFHLGLNKHSFWVAANCVPVSGCCIC